MDDDKKKPFKAVMAGIMTGLTAVGFALEDNAVTWKEGSAIALAVVVAVGAVYGIRNPQV